MLVHDLGNDRTAVLKRLRRAAGRVGHIGQLNVWFVFKKSKYRSARSDRAASVFPVSTIKFGSVWFF